MEVIIKKKKLRKECNEIKEAQKAYGKECGKRLLKRLNELRSFKHLAEIRTLPQVRCHELRGNRKGQFSLDLKLPKVLIVKPEGSIPRTEDGRIIWEEITTVEIVEVTDETHWT